MSSFSYDALNNWVLNDFSLSFFYVLGSDSEGILFWPCLFVGLFVGWTTFILVITFKPFKVEPLYLASKFLVTRASHSYKKIELWHWPRPVTYFKEFFLTSLTLVITFKPFEIEPLYLACRFLVIRASHPNKKKDDLWPWPWPLTYFK